MDKATEQRTAALRIPEELFIIGQPFTRNELGAMASRGYLRETLPGHYLDTRHEYTAAVRAQIARYAAGAHYRDGEVFARSTAAWIHGLIPHCGRLNIAGAHYRRPVPPRAGISFDFHQVLLDEQETLRRGQVLLSNMLRTVCDMACHDPLPLAVQALERVLLMNDEYLNLASINTRLGQYPPGSPLQRALRLVESMTRQAA